MTDSDVELLPCPFCGSTSAVVWNSADGCWSVECYDGAGGCMAEVSSVSQSAAITAWNTRAALAATPMAQMREALVKARDTFQHYGDLHKAKDTREGHQKAAVNYALALEMDEALTGEAP